MSVRVLTTGFWPGQNAPPHINLPRIPAQVRSYPIFPEDLLPIFWLTASASFSAPRAFCGSCFSISATTDDAFLLVTMVDNYCRDKETTSLAATNYSTKYYLLYTYNRTWETIGLDRFLEARSWRVLWLVFENPFE